MRIKFAKYLCTAVKKDQFPEQVLPAVTMLGRSNVGKSSLINGLANHRGLARISSQPGKTRTINFYLFDNTWYLVDLPGYGYAKVSYAERDNWCKMVDEYMSHYEGERLFWQLVDIRHAPTEQDIQMWQWLCANNVKKMLIATKADKISRGARDKNLAVISRAMGLPRQEIKIFSSVTKEGKEELVAEIADFLGVE
ncbi:MAG: ribosome biogenesis GTP-binding protein YihA/YsxC [Clostridia bacterium]|jgi:GTP-binding protein|nr:ribosome biogenesis GTP-binding protein YihA/YsxC [Clostridia bacterium]MDD4571281.1 ribosome biogenesis GTP-binding protein YihA/YsxC [Clostridia bacterium]